MVISTGASIFQVNANKLRRLLDTVDLEELPDSREHTGAPVLWHSGGGQSDVWELFSDNSFLSAILDRQGLSVASPKIQKVFHHSCCRAFDQSSKNNNSRMVVTPPTVTTKKVTWPWQNIKSSFTGTHR